MVETINTTLLATTLNNSWGKSGNKEPLKVMVEVNTSNEESKLFISQNKNKRKKLN